MIAKIASTVSALSFVVFVPPVYACPHTCVTQTDCTDRINPGYEKCGYGKDWRGVHRCINEGKQCGYTDPSAKKEDDTQVAAAQCKLKSV